MIHPATVLLLCATLLLTLPQLGLMPLALVTGGALLAALCVCPQRLGKMLRRMRWLLLTTALLFVFATPGVYVPAFPAVSYEGLQLGAHQLLCLLLFVALLSVVLQTLGQQGLIAALYALMWPARCLGLNRDRAALRLLLVLDYLEQAPAQQSWRVWLTPESMSLPVAQTLTLQEVRWGLADGLLLVAALLWMVMR